MRMLANARRRGLSARSAARRCAALAFGLATLAGTASRAAASVDEADWATPTIGRTTSAASTVRHARRPRADRREQHIAHHRRSSATPDHGPALSHGTGEVAAAREWRPHAAPAHRKTRRLGTMLASLGRELIVPMPQERPSLSGAPIRWIASADCLARPLRTVLIELAQSFGHLQVNSTCRGRSHNARVGGAKRSFHLTGRAADFRVYGKPRTVLAFLRARKDVGGLKHYGGGLFHIDTGPRRTW